VANELFSTMQMLCFKSCCKFTSDTHQTLKLSTREQVKMPQKLCVSHFVSIAFSAEINKNGNLCV